MTSDLVAFVIALELVLLMVLILIGFYGAYRMVREFREIDPRG